MEREEERKIAITDIFYDEVTASQWRRGKERTTKAKCYVDRAKRKERKEGRENLRPIVVA